MNNEWRQTSWFKTKEQLQTFRLAVLVVVVAIAALKVGGAI